MKKFILGLAAAFFALLPAFGSEDLDAFLTPESATKDSPILTPESTTKDSPILTPESTPKTKDSTIPPNATNISTKPAKSTPRWLFGTAILDIYFMDGTLKHSFGIQLNDGYFLSDAAVFGERLPRLVEAKMMDDSADILICVARLGVLAIDETSGLALLKTSQSSDDYCAPRGRSYYHNRIAARYVVDVFGVDSVESSADLNADSAILNEKSAVLNADSATLNAESTDSSPNPNAESNTKHPALFAPTMTPEYALESAPLGHTMHKHEHGEGHEGTGFGVFDENGAFVGIHANDRLVPQREVVEFLCNMNAHNIFLPHEISKKCAPNVAAKSPKALESGAKNYPFYTIIPRS